MDAADYPARIETLLDELYERGESERADALVRAVTGLYGEGLARLVALLDERALRCLAADDLVANLLLLHGLHPDDLDTRIQSALDRVRPYLGSHAGGVEFLGVDEQGVAQLRLQGTCDGCPSSTATVESAIEAAVLGAAPEVVGVRVEGMVAPGPTLLQIGRAPLDCPVPEAIAP